MLKSLTWLSVLYFSFITTFVSVSGIKQTCPRFHIKRVRENTIVKPHESKANGAEFLAVILASGYRDCYDECCKRDTCDMVNVKVDNSAEEKRIKCYMFECKSPSKCRFHSVQEPSVEAKYSVLEFESRDVNINPLSSTTARKNQQREENTTDNTERPVVEKPKKQKHEWWKHWSDHDGKKKSQEWHDNPTTESPHFDNTDHRNSNSYDKKGEEYGTWSNTKETTTKYHRETEVPITELPTIAKKTETEDKKPETEYGSYVGSKYSFDRNHDAIGNQEGKVEEPTDPTDLDEDFPRRVFVDNNPDYPELPKTHRKIPRSTNPPATEKKMTKPSMKNKKHKVTTKKAPTKPGNNGYNNVVIKRFSIQENKAVIPLAVGLVLSLLLLMAVVFRLKTSRRRRTKAFLTDDADYLINGMYL